MQESKALLDLRELLAELVAPYEKIDPRRVERLADFLKDARAQSCRSPKAWVRTNCALRAAPPR